MRRRFIQCWSIILLVAGRLVLGDLAHATPHVEAFAVTHAQSAGAALSHPGRSDHCATAVVDGGARRSAPAQAGGAIHDADCCDAGGCACACAHLYAIITSPLTPRIATPLRHRTVAARMQQDRLWAVFRPPA